MSIGYCCSNCQPFSSSLRLRNNLVPFSPPVTCAVCCWWRCQRQKEHNLIFIFLLEHAWGQLESSSSNCRHFGMARKGWRWLRLFLKYSLFSHCLYQDNFLRGDSSRKVQHQQQRKPRKKTKPPALTKKHKKKRRRGPRRPQKPIPPAVPQGNLSMPTSVSLPVEISHIRSAAAASFHLF